MTRRRPASAGAGGGAEDRDGPAWEQRLSALDDVADPPPRPGAVDGAATATATTPTTPTTPDTAAGRDGRDGLDGGEATDPSDDPPERHRPLRHRLLLDWVVVIVVAMLVAFLVRTFVLAHFVVDGESMESTLHDADRVFVNKLSYHLHDPNRGDVVVLHELSGTSDRDLIKRVIALPGETVEVRSCQVTVNGQVLEEPYLDAAARMPGECGNDQSPLTVPEDHVFVMGDNRGHSLDSRDLGPIDEDNLVGRAFVVFWPSDRWQWL